MRARTKKSIVGSQEQSVSRMRKWLAGLLVWLLQGVLGADSQEGPVLDGIRCSRCTNFFWITDAHLESPTFCPYCGVRFTGHKAVSDFNDLGH